MMKQDNIETTEVKIPERRQFINKAGLVTVGAILGLMIFSNGCKFFESTDDTDESQSPGYTIPTGVSRIENLAEVKAALRNEKEQLDAFSNDLRQLQLDMNELYDMFAQIEPDGMDTTSSQEHMLILQLLMDKKDQAEKTISNILKVFQNTQRDIVSNLK